MSFLRYLYCYVIFIIFFVLLMFTLPVSEVWCISSPYMVFIPFSSLNVTHLGKILRPVVCLTLYQTAYQRLCRLLCLSLEVKVNIFVLLVELVFWMTPAPWFRMITRKQNSSSGSSLPMDALYYVGFINMHAHMCMHLCIHILIGVLVQMHALITHTWMLLCSLFCMSLGKRKRYDFLGTNWKMMFAVKKGLSWFIISEWTSLQTTISLFIFCLLCVRSDKQIIKLISTHKKLSFLRLRPKWDGIISFKN